MQIERFGLTIWANGEGKNERGFGIRFPLGLGRQGGQRGQRGQPGMPGQPGQPGQRAPRGRAPQGPAPQGAASPGGAPAPASAQVGRDFEMIGPKETDRLRVQAAADQPVVAVLGGDASSTIVELRVPLKATEGHPLAVGAAPGATVALGLTTERPPSSRGPGGRHGGPPSPAGQPEGAAPAGSEGGAAPAAPGGGQGSPAAAALAAPGGDQGAVPVFGRPAGRSGAYARGGRDTTPAVNVWVRVAVAKKPAPSAKGPASAQAPAPKVEKAAAPAPASVPQTKQPAPPAPTPAPPKTP